MPFLHLKFPVLVNHFVKVHFSETYKRYLSLESQGILVICHSLKEVVNKPEIESSRTSCLTWLVIYYLALRQVEHAVHGQVFVARFQFRDFGDHNKIGKNPLVRNYTA